MVSIGNLGNYWFDDDFGVIKIKVLVSVDWFYFIDGVGDFCLRCGGVIVLVLGYFEVFFLDVVFIFI